MKFLPALAVALVLSVTVANNARSEEHKNENVTAQNAELKDVKDDKRVAYKMAKKACLKENKDLRGKSLKECIVSKNK